MVKISVIICTYNRNRELEGTIKGIFQQKSSQSNYEIIIVDNSPIRRAREIFNKYSKNLPELKYEHEPELGLNNARNYGVQVARGEWIAFLDDDAIPEKFWLNNIIKAIDTIPRFGVIGGKVIPMFPKEPPKWLTQELYPSLSSCDYPSNGNFKKLDFPLEYPVGANIVYPVSLLKEFNGFKPNLDRTGENLLSGGETDLNYRIQRAGYPIWYCPKFVVHHQIPTTRMKKEFYRSRVYWAGRTWALLHFEWFGLSFLKQELLKRLSIGLTYRLARSLISSIFIRKNIFLFELYFHELAGYIIQGIEILRIPNSKK